MSKLKKPILISLWLVVCWSAVVRAQPSHTLEATIVIEPASASATVRGSWTSAAASRRNLSFLVSAIGAPDLGGRISNVTLKNAAGQAVDYRAFSSAEYVAEGDFRTFIYDIDLKPLVDPRSAAHASWIGREAALILPDDILPQISGKGPKRAILSIQIPDGWTMVSSDIRLDNGSYRIENLERSVFVIGRSIRHDRANGQGRRLSVAVSGEWLFDETEARQMADEVYSEYFKIFGHHPAGYGLMVLLPIPQPGIQKGVWEAETRGSTVVIASSDMAFKMQSVQRLHEQLRHEIFHLWLPNGVNLTGRYDWFYEGFALYQSLRTGVAVNRIRFEDFLDTLSRAHNIDRFQTRRRSLIEASQERWNGADTQLYARGMIVAFLCDLVLLQASNGKSSVETLLSRLYAAHKFPAAAADANTSVLKLFEADPRLSALAADYISGAKPIDWASIIDAAGLENEPGTSRTSLRIKPKLTGRQKALLDKLGYNNWRKLTRK